MNTLRTLLGAIVFSIGAVCLFAAKGLGFVAEWLLPGDDE